MYIHSATHSTHYTLPAGMMYTVMDASYTSNVCVGHSSDSSLKMIHSIPLKNSLPVVSFGTHSFSKFRHFTLLTKNG